MATLINLGDGAGSTNGDTLYEAFVKINTNYSDLESTSNKSINVTTDGASDTKYPSVKAVKTYVDANITASELLINKSINVTTDGASDTKYPSVKAVKTYVDANAGGMPYKIYTALLEFVDGSTINSTVFQNTIGNGSKDGINDIAWSYNSAAQPKAVMTNAPFTNLKTLCSNSIYNVNMNLQGIRMTNQECRFYSNNINTGASSLSFVPYVFVEIKVYN